MTTDHNDWLAKNLHELVLSAKAFYAQHGRGMILVDIHNQAEMGTGHPFSFVPLADIPFDLDARDMVRDYEPNDEIVVSLVEEGSISSYQVQIPKAPK